MSDTQHPTLNYPARVRIVEVGPRDGLQNESIIVPTEAKVRYVRLLAEAGFQDIEITSFVSPKRVPQLADASDLCEALRLGEGARGTGGVPEPNAQRLTPRYSALVPNQKGLDRALEAGIRAIAVFTAASETFTQTNIGMTIAESLDTFRALIPTALAAGSRIRAYVSTAFYCPYEGPISPEKVFPVVDSLSEIGVDEISIGDTIGHAVPTDVAKLLDALQAAPISHLNVALHFHDTRGTALANVLMALQYGIGIFDSSAGGVGGCPFAPGAAGNLATEDLVYMLHGMGIKTGVDLDKVVDASRYLSTVLGRPLPGKYLQSCS
jgi:hydroxymethylglutaryl-CoA lyase